MPAITAESQPAVPLRVTTTPERGVWERILMRAIYDPLFFVAEHVGMARRRRALLAHAEGRVLEIGAGTGLNAGHWPDGLDELIVTEPVASLVPRIERRLRRAGREARVVAAEAERLPLPDASVDTVVSTMVLCTVGDVPASLAEIRRVLRPGGRLLFIEHVLADGRWRRRLQQLVHRPWRTFGGGCNCNLRTLALLADAGFVLEEVERAAWRGMPFCVKPLVIGGARA